MNDGSSDILAFNCLEKLAHLGSSSIKPGSELNPDVLRLLRERTVGFVLLDIYLIFSKISDYLGVICSYTFSI